MAARKKIGEILLDKGLIDELQLRSAIGHQKNWGGKLGSALVELGIVNQDQIARVLTEQLHERCINEREIQPDPEALKLLTMQEALRYKVFPLSLGGNELTLAMSNPFDLSLIDELGFKLGKRIKGVLAIETCVNKAIKKYYGTGAAAWSQVTDIPGRTIAPQDEEAGPEEIGAEASDYSEPGVKISITDEDEDPSPELVHYGEAQARAAAVMEKAHAAAAARPGPKPKKVEPSTELITKALAFILIEKGLIKRDELIEKMKALQSLEEK